MYFFADRLKIVMAILAYIGNTAVHDEFLAIVVIAGREGENFLNKADKVFSLAGEGDGAVGF